MVTFEGLALRALMVSIFITYVDLYHPQMHLPTNRIYTTED